MPLVNKKSIYVSLKPELIAFVAEHTKRLNINQSKWIASLIEREFKLEQQKKIDRILSGGKDEGFKTFKKSDDF